MKYLLKVTMADGVARFYDGVNQFTPSRSEAWLFESCESAFRLALRYFSSESLSPPVTVAVEAVEHTIQLAEHVSKSDDRDGWEGWSFEDIMRNAG